MFTDYSDSILIKTYNYEDNLNESYIKSFYDETINYNTTILNKIDIKPDIVGLYKWLLCIPNIKKVDSQYIVNYYKLNMSNAYNMPLIKNMTYYKLPHPKKLILKKIVCEKY